MNHGAVLLSNLFYGSLSTATSRGSHTGAWFYPRELCGARSIPLLLKFLQIRELIGVPSLTFTPQSPLLKDKHTWFLSGSDLSSYYPEPSPLVMLRRELEASCMTRKGSGLGRGQGTHPGPYSPSYASSLPSQHPMDTV